MLLFLICTGQKRSARSVSYCPVFRAAASAVSYAVLDPSAGSVGSAVPDFDYS